MAFRDPKIVQWTAVLSAARTTVPFVLGATPNKGNLLIAELAYIAGDGVTPPDTGWTLIKAGTYNTDGISTYQKRVVNEPRNHTFTITGTSDQASGILVEVYGSDKSNPINGSAVSAGETSTTHPTSSLTPTTIGCLALSWVAPDDATCTLVSVSAGWVAGISAYGAGSTFHPSQIAQRTTLTSDLTTGISNTFILNTSTAGGGVNDGLTIIVLIAPDNSKPYLGKIPAQQRFDEVW